MSVSSAPWRVEPIDRAVVDRVAAAHGPSALAVELRVDLFTDPHSEDDDGRIWALARQARDVRDVVPGSVVVIGTHAGRWLARVLSWDLEVDPDNPIITLDLLPVAPEAVSRALARNQIGE